MASANSAIYEISEPVVEPVSLEEAKNHLRVSSDFTDDDALIRTLIRMARIDAEAKTGGRIFPTREFEWLPDFRQSFMLSGRTLTARRRMLFPTPFLRKAV